MQDCTNTRNHRLTDDSPGLGTDVPGRDCIGWSRETTPNTNKLVPRLSVLLVDVSTLGALPRSILGIDKNNGDSCLLRLVGHEGSQLSESPVRQPRPLVLSGRYPFSDTAKVFQGDSRDGAFSICDDCLGNNVVGVFLKTFLLPGNCSGIRHPFPVEALLSLLLTESLSECQ